jgi:nitrate reductase gamma subunit
MTDTEFLLWVRGPAFNAATFILCAGLVIRFLEIFLLGRKADLAEARGSAAAGGLRTMFTRFIPDAGSFERSGFTIVSGYIFHIGLFIIIFLFVPHILVFEAASGLSWPGLPSNIVDATNVVTMIALLGVLIHRIKDPVMRMLSEFNDYLVWFVTFLPLLTGYLAFHRVGLSAPMLIGLHILSVELLMILFPFTKLSHAFTLWMARWYNGAIAGYKGVQS